MTTKISQLSSPRSAGAEGVKFEIHVASSFVTLMLAGGFAPCLPPFPITKVMLQAKWAGHDVDDFVVFTTDPRNGQVRRLSCQIKETISVGDNEEFRQVIAAAYSDFCKPERFTPGIDALALIKGPLSPNDANHLRTILEWARSGSDCDGFMTKVGLSNFSSEEKREGLKVFRQALTTAKGSDITDQELFDFLKHFHFLGYDLDIKAGVTLSLLHSLISAYSPDEAHSLWTQIVYEIQSLNTVAGEITIDTIPEPIRNGFVQRVMQTIPQELSHSFEQEHKKSWLNFKHPTTLAAVNLVGGWADTHEEDQNSISKFVQQPVAKWNEDVHDILLEPNSPLKLTNGRWHITDRLKLWEDMGPRIFDKNLTQFNEFAIEVLSELDPKYELEPEIRIAASVMGKNMKHSKVLRANIAETLALLATKREPLTNLSVFRAESVPIVVVRKVFENSSWQLWATLGSLLPTLAEAAPEQFLNAVEEALQQNPCPFDEIFAQEGDGLFMGNYMTNILWALESLAWNEELLIPVCLILAQLDNIDPGGKTSNRPLGSLTNILLPWYPQTLATPQKRMLAFANILEDLPEVAWRLVNQLLPNRTNYSMGSIKPKWRVRLPEEWKPNVPNSEYLEQMRYYSDAAVNMAKSDLIRTLDLSKSVENFSPETLIKFIEQISVDELSETTEIEKMNLWKGLSEFKDGITNYQNIDKSVKQKAMTRLNKIIKAIKPTSPSQLYNRLFSNDHFPRDKKNETFEERETRLNNTRQDALKAIVNFGGIDEAITFSKAVDDPFAVGRALAELNQSEFDLQLLPKFLNSEDLKELQMIDAFIKFRFRGGGWNWAENLGLNNWSADEKACFLISTHFTMETWQKVEQHLGIEEQKYWSKVLTSGFIDKADMIYAVDKLLLYNRPSAALKCIYRSGNNDPRIDIDRSLKALKGAAFSEEPYYSRISPYEIANVLKKLQEAELSADQYKELAIIEWIYLPFLERHDKTIPKSLHYELASDPEFYMEIIRMIYRSENDDPNAIEITPEKRKLALNAYKLLSEWRTVPGIQRDGSFSETAFENWIKEVKKRSQESGHWKIASQQIGKVLYYSPADPNGLWINRVVAKELNQLQNDKMRDGFSSSAYNSGGLLRPVDPTGKYEETIGDKFRNKAAELENARFSRFATTIRKLGDSYYRDAERARNDNEDQ